MKDVMTVHMKWRPSWIFQKRSRVTKSIQQILKEDATEISREKNLKLYFQVHLYFHQANLFPLRCDALLPLIVSAYYFYGVFATMYLSLIIIESTSMSFGHFPLLFSGLLLCTCCHFQTVYKNLLDEALNVEQFKR